MLILASASPRRLELLKRIGISPDKIIPADIDESVHLNEVPRLYALRVALQKAQFIAATYPNDIILSADTVVSIGRRILPKAEDAKTARLCLETLSGRNHDVTTAIVAMQNGKIAKRAVQTKIKFKLLSPQEIDNYIQSNEWHGKAGGYGIQGLAGAYVMHLNGSWEGVMGLPLYETQCMLDGFGYKK
jgi:septum formation protein